MVSISSSRYLHFLNGTVAIGHLLTRGTVFIKEKQLQPSAQNCWLSSFFIILNQLNQMGNSHPSTHPSLSGESIDTLCSIIQHSYHTPSKLNFDPFNPSFSLPTFEKDSSHFIQSDILISMEVEENEETQPSVAHSHQQKHSFEAQNKKSSSLQKNQFSNQENGKIKNKQTQLKHKEICKDRVSTVQKQANQVEVEEIETVGQDCIRDQNNCKSYHKLVRNYLHQKNLGSLIEQYSDKYHTRYYFIVALMIIQENLKEDFLPIYQKLVNEELSGQEKKIIRKNAEIAKINSRILQQKIKQADSSALLLSRSKLYKQIEHIKVIQYQIGTFSLRSCQAFFQGKTEESLRILYLKDDLVMRKKYYFENAVTILKQIEKKVRKLISYV